MFSYNFVVAAAVSITRSHIIMIYPPHFMAPALSWITILDTQAFGTCTPLELPYELHQNDLKAIFDHGITSGIPEHSKIIKLAKHSPFVDFIIKIRRIFIAEFAKHRTSFPKFNVEALLLGQYYTLWTIQLHHFMSQIYFGLMSIVQSLV